MPAGASSLATAPVRLGRACGPYIAPDAGAPAGAIAPAGPDFEAAGPDFEAAGPDVEAAGPDFKAAGPDFEAAQPNLSVVTMVY